MTPTSTPPEWFAPLAAVASVASGPLARFTPPPGHDRLSAVLILFGESEAGPDVLLTERAATLRSHAGQVAFPGGGVDGSETRAQAALREAVEETGLDPAGVAVVAVLPDLYLPVSDFAVAPVLAWWREPSPVGVVDAAEVARVVRVPIAELVDPEHRFRVVHPNGYAGPGFRAGGLFVWGFTAALLDRLIQLCGWERPWDVQRVERPPLAADERVELPPVPAGGELDGRGGRIGGVA